MSEYRIICAVRGSRGEIESLGYSENGSDVMYDALWTLEQVRRAIEGGCRLYTVNPSSGEEAELERCDNGIRTKASKGTDTTLEQLPECG